MIIKTIIFKSTVNKLLIKERVLKLKIDILPRARKYGYIFGKQDEEIHNWKNYRDSIEF